MFAPPGHHAPHSRILSFESAQSLLPLLVQRASVHILFVACRRRARGSLLAAGICTSTNYAQSVPLLPRPVGFYP